VAASHARGRRRPPRAELPRAQVYVELRTAILQGTLPPLERITENQIAARFGLSRTPVREAFRRLEAEGLIQVVPQRGSFVSQPSLEGILEIYQIRTPLEAMATRVAAETIEAGPLKRLEEILALEQDRRLSAERSLRLNREFHAVIVACARNRRLTSMLVGLQDEVHRVRVLWPSTVARLDETWKEHAAILAALKAHDPAAAERCMREHLERARASTVKGILPRNSEEHS
jgi:DNA-binding GntR family transcriptional regulator